MPVLRKSAYLVIEHRVASRLVCFVRSAEPFLDAPSVRHEVGAWARAIAGLVPAELGLLLDWRLAALVSDPKILNELVSRTDAIGRLFDRQAILLATPLGALQTARLARAHRTAPEVFTDEAAAFAYAMSR